MLTAGWNSLRPALSKRVKVDVCVGTENKRAKGGGKANMLMDEKMRERITDENEISGTGLIGACL
jgi:hypothetical protein